MKVENPTHCIGPCSLSCVLDVTHTRRTRDAHASWTRRTRISIGQTCLIVLDASQTGVCQAHVILNSIGPMFYGNVFLRPLTRSQLNFQLRSVFFTMSAPVSSFTRASPGSSGNPINLCKAGSSGNPIEVDDRGSRGNPIRVGLGMPPLEPPRTPPPAYRNDLDRERRLRMAFQQEGDMRVLDGNRARVAAMEARVAEANMELREMENQYVERHVL